MGTTTTAGRQTPTSKTSGRSAARLPQQPKSGSDNLLKVGARSDPSKVAGAIAGTIREHGKAEMQTIGARALNQAIKAIAISRGHLAPQGINLICWPAFVDVEIDGNERTAIKLFVEPRSR